MIFFTVMTWLQALDPGSFTKDLNALISLKNKFHV
jgi:hypothetical protein